METNLFGFNDPIEISASKLSQYIKCPLSYKFKYIDHLKVPALPHLVFGDTIHFFLSKFWKGDHPKYKSPESFANAWSGYWWQRIQGKLRDEEIKFFNPKVDPIIYELYGKRVLIDFYKKNASLPKPILIEEKFDVLYKDFLLVGKWDRVDERKGRKIIIDYKLTSYDDVVADKDLQFTLYSLAYELIYGERVPIIYYDISLRNYEGGVMFVTQRDEDDYEELYKKMIEISEKINNKQFNPNFGFHCKKRCEYKDICKEIYPSAFRRRNKKGEIEEELTDSRRLIDVNPEKWLYDLYPDMQPKPKIEKEKKQKTYEYFLIAEGKKAGTNLERAISIIDSYGKWEYEVVRMVPDVLIDITSLKELPRGVKKKIIKKKIKIANVIL